MYKHLVYHHLVGWMSQNGVFPLDREIDVCIESCYAFADLACAQREHGRIGTSWHIQRGSLIRNFNMYSGGSMDNKMYIKEENILVRPLPLMSKGESNLV